MKLSDILKLLMLSGYFFVEQDMLRVFFHLNKIRSFIHLIGFDFTLMLHDVLWTIGQDRYLSSRKFSLD